MKGVSHETLNPGRSLAVLGFVVAALTFLPGLASAQVANVRTIQLLPPGQNTCQTPTLLNVTPNVYDGTLQSFDVTISDGSYVGVLASVGTSQVPLQYMTRWSGGAGAVKIHVDTPTTPVNGALPVNLTVMSALPGQPVCVTQVTFTVSGVGMTTTQTGGGAQTSGTGNGTGGQTSTNTTQPTNSGPASQTGTGSVTGTQTKGNTSSSSSLSGVGVGQAYTGGLVAAGAPITGLRGLGNICIGSNAYRLWVILLLVYIIIAAMVVFAEPWFLEESVLGLTAAILVPLILLLGFWYFSAGCRAASWIPVVACLIAIVALFLAFREQESAVIMLPEKIS